MKLAEALLIARKPPSQPSQPWRVLLACGFTPLHLGTFLHAHLRLALPTRNVSIFNGLFGDLAGTVEAALTQEADAVAVAVEWPDLDQRLSVRSQGGWEPSKWNDIFDEVARSGTRLAARLNHLADRVPVAVSLPSLPPPPASFASPGHASAWEVRLFEVLSQMASAISAHPRISLLNRWELDRVSPPAQRHDVKAELSAGFPYQIAHTSELARLLALLLAPPPPKKGLITDLDDTVWHGIVGEDGPENVAWSLERHAQQHGLYQQLLSSLLQTGTLVGVASKNDPSIAGRALDRADLLLPRSELFPVECNWGPKSKSIQRILAAWNIGADSVVFIDDSPLELEEVAQAHPGIECIRFPKENPAAVWDLCHRLRELFGKPGIREEDRLRGASLRNAAEMQRAMADTGQQETVLEQAAAVIQDNWTKEPADPRALELINKTNQFNLNGRRWTESDWLSFLRREDSFLVVSSYQDKFGPLGKIAVAAARRAGDGTAVVESWVMSCRAFSRRIEHHMLLELFDRLGVERIQLEYAATDRNGPLTEFLTALGVPLEPGVMPVIERSQYRERMPQLYRAHEMIGLPVSTPPANGAR